MTGEHLRRLRKKLKLTQIELATRLGVHPITVSKWETGVHQVSEPVARLLGLFTKMTPRKGHR